jgi:hypothetical protein
MPRWQRVYLAACCAVLGFAIGYAMCEYAGWPRVLYDAVRREVYLGRPPTARQAVSYWGLLLYGAAGALVAGGAGWGFGAVARRPMSDRWVRLIGAWTLTAVVLVGAFFTWSLWPFG